MGALIDEYGDYGLLSTEPDIAYYFEISIPVEGKENTYEFLLVRGDILVGDVTMVKRWPVEEFDDRPDIKEIEKMRAAKKEAEAAKTGKGGNKKS